MKRLFSYFIMLTVFSLTAQWELQDSGTTENLNDVFCLNPDTVMVVGENGTILRTTDGGTNWLPLAGITTHNLKEVQFAGATGYILGENNTLLKSTDYGASWQPLGVSTNDTIMALYVYSADTVYVAGTNGLIMKTADGGNNWTVIPGPTSYDLNDIEVPAEEIIYIIPHFTDADNFEEILFKSRNDGNGWYTYTLNSGTNLVRYEKIKCKDTTEIYGLRWKGSAIKINIMDTTLMGSFYSGAYSMIGNDIYITTDNKIWVPNLNTLICSDQQNYLLTLNIDSLNNFNLIGLYNSGYPIYNAIHFAKDTIGYMVGEEGHILKNPTGQYGFSIEKNKNQTFILFPNPARETIRIDFKFPMKNTRLEIYNTTGELMIAQAIQDHETVNVAELPAGAYIVQIKSERYVSSQKLIKK